MSEYVFKLPDLGEGTVESEIAEWKVQVGDEVVEEAVVCVVLTDKAAVELSAPVSGKVVSLGGEAGETIAVGSALIVFETSDEEAPADGAPEAAAAKPAEAEPATAQAPPIQPSPARHAPSDKRLITSPSIRRKAREADVDLSRVTPSGPNGRILASDFEAYLQQTRSAGAPPGNVAVADEVTTTKVIGLRRMIAQRMAQAKREIPHFAYVEEVDITQLESLRQHLNAGRNDAAARLTVLPFIALALVRALKSFPQCNATYDTDENTLSQYRAVHMGIATQTPDGLKVPVVRHSEQHGVEQMAAEIRRVSEAARNNTASKQELAGSTITLTSLGKLGGVVSTPVINLPEVAIIGVNKAVERPVVLNGRVVIRTMMNLSSSFDHRFVDGFDAAAMIQEMKNLLEQPATLFMP